MGAQQNSTETLIFGRYLQMCPNEGKEALDGDSYVWPALFCVFDTVSCLKVQKKHNFKN